MGGSYLSAGCAWRSRQDGQKGAKPVCQLHLHFPWGGVEGGSCRKRRGEGGCPLLTNALPLPPFVRELHPLHERFFTSVNFKLRNQRFLLLSIWPTFSRPNILSWQSKEDMKYEQRQGAISCDLVQVWASARRRGFYKICQKLFRKSSVLSY